MHELLKTIIKKSIELFNANDLFMIENDYHEQNIAQKLAFYIEKHLMDFNLQEYDVDVEFNRGYNGDNSASKKLDGSNIRIDIAVHKREYDILCGYENLICIEMKKSTNRRGIFEDKKRLKSLTSLEKGYLYQYGIMIIINIQENKLEIESEYFIH